MMKKERAAKAAPKALYVPLRSNPAQLHKDLEEAKLKAN